MSHIVNSDAIAQKHGLEGKTLKLFQQYTAAHIGRQVLQALKEVQGHLIPSDEKQLENLDNDLCHLTLEASGHPASLNLAIAEFLQAN